MKRFIFLALSILVIGSSVSLAGQVKSTALEASHILSASLSRSSADLRFTNSFTRFHPINLGTI